MIDCYLLYWNYLYDESCEKDSDGHCWSFSGVSLDLPALQRYAETIDNKDNYKLQWQAWDRHWYANFEHETLCKPYLSVRFKIESWRLIE